MQPRRYTELFFFDEPGALAAGHRPCGLCRHKEFTLFKHLFCQTHGTRTLDQIDRMMQAARVTRARGQVRHQARGTDLPDGAFILWQGAAHLVWGRHVLRFQDGAYTARLPRPAGPVTVLIPAPTVAVLNAGYRPAPHPKALALLG